MRRRHRRVLFNVFAFLLLGVAIYLNMFRAHEENLPSSKTNKLIVRTTEIPGPHLKNNPKEIHKN